MCISISLMADGMPPEKWYKLVELNKFIYFQLQYLTEVMTS